ncbi:MAG: 2-oxoglutarate and iron-dependent oxygenase domain-containing protein [Pseudomonadota bacterium]
MKDLDLSNVPVIDISAWTHGDVASRLSLAKEVDQACKEWGFLLVGGHGIDQALIDAMFETSYAFFDQDAETKEQYASAGRKGGRGYFSVGMKALARTSGDVDAKGDQKETFLTGAEPVAGDPFYDLPGADRLYAPNPWPDTPAAMVEVWDNYRAACKGVADTLMSIFATALGMPPDWFEARSDKPVSTLVAHHYPAQTEPPEPGALRAGAHTDFGTLTLLMTENRPGGLQVQGLDGEWYDVQPLPGAFIVNIGDLMQRWTNDVWRSTMHRVVNPPANAGSAARRMSVVYFCNPNFDTEVACFSSLLDAGQVPKYEATTVGEHYLKKIALNNSAGKSS